MARTHPKKLLVEGKEEIRVISHFIDQFVVWGDKPSDWVIHVKDYEGVDDLLKASNIETEAQEPGLEVLGILIDADDEIEARWAAVRARCLKITTDFPSKLPSEGLIHQTTQGLRVGVWIMPDNSSRGMLETFLGALVTPTRTDLWGFARETCTQSRGHGAPYTDPHFDKACIYTLLAWLEPPGRSLNVSVQDRVFNARLPLADRFAKWFIDLYQLTPR
jgi:hypothetical protein